MPVSSIDSQIKTAQFNDDSTELAINNCRVSALFFRLYSFISNRRTDNMNRRLNWQTTPLHSGKSPRRGMIACPLLALWIAIAILHATGSADVWSVSPSDTEGRLEIKLRGKPFATYSYRDTEITRPFFANVFAPSGAKITRNLPQAPDDPQDHPTMHPGVWLAFGDLSGADSWRMKAPVEHVRFIEKPQIDGDLLRFSVENRYLSADPTQQICRERCDYTFQLLSAGVLLLCDSIFRNDTSEFVFGDQEELGLGVRLARTVAVKGGQGGRILNSNGQRNEEEAWGQQADWCDYSGPVGSEFVGILLMPHPNNVRRSWCHARDTGFMAMNPFGHNAFTGSEKSAIAVAPGESLQLRYGVLFHWHSDPSHFNPQQEFERYTKIAAD
jgi:hypothetical protein